MPPQGVIDAFCLMDHVRLPERSGSRIVLLVDELSQFV
jgi:hypothetical protein